MLKEKIQGKNRKLYHMDKMYKQHIDFDDYKFIHITNKNNYIFKGCCYSLSNYEKNKEKINEILEKFDNTHIFKTYCEYAPEIKKVWLFIGR